MRPTPAIAPLALLIACAGKAESEAGAEDSASGDTGPDGYRSAVYSDEAAWLCHPDKADDVCDANLDATAIAADGTATIVPHNRADNPDFDCFYVYPTMSLDPTANADMEPGPEEEGMTFNQVGRMTSVCRVFAPVYRQGTVTALFSDGLEADYDLAYADVLDAWSHYLAQHNGGRGVVLLGHSQGAGMLRRLVAEAIEPDPAQSDLLIAAYLIGTRLSVPAGETTGGDLATTPLCATSDDFGCAVGYLSFRDDEPPGVDSVFGLPEDGTDMVCVHPGDPGSGSGTLQATFPTAAAGSVGALLGGSTSPWADEDAFAPLTTPFFTLPGLVTGTCTPGAGLHHLEISVLADPADARADDIGGDFLAGWGLHLIDVNLGMGDIIDSAAARAAAWDAR